MRQLNAGRVSGFGLLGIIVLLATVAAPSAHAADEKFDVGLRYVLVSARGVPTNDMMGVGLIARYRLNDKWLVGLTIDQLSGDVERPYLQFFGDESPDEIDTTLDSTIITLLAEREYGSRDRTLRWFTSAGLGFTSPDADPVSGPLIGGGTFDIAIDPGSETLLSLAGGFRRSFSKRYGFEIALRWDQHFADWKVTDRADGSTTTLSDWDTMGLTAGLHVRF